MARAHGPVPLRRFYTSAARYAACACARARPRRRCPPTFSASLLHTLIVSPHAPPLLDHPSELPLRVLMRAGTTVAFEKSNFKEWPFAGISVSCLLVCVSVCRACRMRVSRREGGAATRQDGGSVGELRALIFKAFSGVLSARTRHRKPPLRGGLQGAGGAAPGREKKIRKVIFCTNSTFPLFRENQLCTSFGTGATRFAPKGGLCPSLFGVGHGHPHGR